jgi:hypothetical protein
MVKKYFNILRYCVALLKDDFQATFFLLLHKQYICTHILATVLQSSVIHC